MNFYDFPKRVPEGLKTAVFHLTPLTPAHVHLDHAALMANIELLRLWGGHDWPTPDFSVADNLTHMEWHSDEHQKRIAFTYTILNPAENHCLGCIYIKPTSEALAENPDLPVSETDALVRFWVREDVENATEVNGRLLQTLPSWFREAWDFTAVYLHTRQENTPQLTLFKTHNLIEIATFHLKERGGKQTLFKL